MATQPRVPSAPGQLLSAYTVTHSPNTFYFIFERKEKKLLVNYCLLVKQLGEVCKTPSENHSANFFLFFSSFYRAFFYFLYFLFFSPGGSFLHKNMSQHFCKGWSNYDLWNIMEKLKLDYWISSIDSIYLGIICYILYRVIPMMSEIIWIKNFRNYFWYFGYVEVNGWTTDCRMANIGFITGVPIIE